MADFATGRWKVGRRPAVFWAGLVGLAAGLGWARADDTPTLSDLGGGHVLSVAFAPDGKTLATGGGARPRGSGVRFWDAGNGEHTATLSGNRSTASWLAFSPDGKSLAAGHYRGSVTVWELNTGKERARWETSAERVDQVAISPDGRTLAVALYPSVRLWDLISLKELPAAKLPGDRFSLAFTPEGKALATPRLPEKVSKTDITVWDVTTGKPHATLKGSVEKNQLVALSPDGKRLVSKSENSIITLWEVGTDKEVVTLGEKLDSPDRFRFAFSADGKTLAIAEREKVSLWETSNGKKRGELKERTSSVISLALSPDGKKLAIADAHDGVKLSDLKEALSPSPR